MADPEKQARPGAMARNVAVVLGASAAGMMAAATLALAYARVIVIERDALDPAAGPAHRKGVGQGRHNHNVTPRATSMLERLFPGMMDELRACGAGVCDIGRDGRWYVEGILLPRVEVGHLQILASRPLLDAILLARLAAMPGVELRDRTDVSGLIRDPVTGRVCGVRQLARRHGSESFLAADLVVDATGRASRTPRWLEGLGLRRPREERVDVDVRYVTYRFRRSPADLGGDRFVYVPAIAPARPRGAVAFAVEGDCWMVVAYSYAEPIPTDLEGFRSFTARLGVPELGGILDGREPLCDVATYAFPRSVRRRYDRVDTPPGLVVVGDALQSTNPSWGLGITSAAIQIETLERRLARGGDPSTGFHRAAIRSSAGVWDPVIARDRAFDAVPGTPDAIWRAINRIVAGEFVAARDRPALARTMLEVIGHVRSPLVLLRPDRALSGLLAGSAAVSP